MKHENYLWRHLMAPGSRCFFSTLHILSFKDEVSVSVVHELTHCVGSSWCKQLPLLKLLRKLGLTLWVWQSRWSFLCLLINPNVVLTQYILKFCVQDTHQQLKESKGWSLLASSFGMFAFPLRKVVPAQAFSDDQERLVSSSIKKAVEQKNLWKPEE